MRLLKLPTPPLQLTFFPPGSARFPPGFRRVPPGSAGFRRVPPSSAEFCQVPDSLRQVPPGSVKFPPGAAGFRPTRLLLPSINIFVPRFCPRGWYYVTFTSSFLLYAAMFQARKFLPDLCHFPAKCLRCVWQSGNQKSAFRNCRRLLLVGKC